MSEQRRVRVNLRSKSYDILIGSGTLEEIGRHLPLLTSSKRAFLISNPTVFEIYGPRVLGNLKAAGFEVISLNVEEGEETKSLESAAYLYGELVENLANRRDPVIALGGGVIGDLAGFVAATFMRGMPFIQVPTTLLSQVDSSVGGKTAVNLPEAKNMVGVFYQPKLVLIDTDTLKSLDPRELKAGFAEVIKCGFLIGNDFLSFLEDEMDRIFALDEVAVSKVIETCCNFKARVVEEDEEDFGKRAILNYGHTIGHALESLFGFAKYRHGEAIAVGMVCAAKISHRLGLLDEESLERHIRIISKASLEYELPKISADQLIRQIMLDKKGERAEVNFILLEKAGKPIIKRLKIAEAVALLEI
ncbi:MAG: 3-dehydroquinate synthase [Actinomycetota bacterium]|nr:3-dehydroquinate synthase [Actinomycetota bacterium]